MNLTTIDIRDLLLLAFSLIFAVHWIFYFCGWGRYSIARRRADSSSMGYLIGTLFAKVITNFRHLLALIVVLIFGVAVIYTMFDPRTFEDKLQTVVAALGGIIGSVLGYYFGEAKVAKEDSSPDASLDGPIEQEPAEGDGAGRAPPVPQAIENEDRQGPVVE